jgi:hypothetical protein
VQSFGQLRLGDLLVAAPGAADEAVRPTTDGRVGAQTLVGYTEIYSDAEAQFDLASLTLEVADAADGRALASVPMRVSAGAEPGRRAAEGSLPLVLLTPGDYVARVVLHVGGRDVLRATRPITIEVNAGAAFPPRPAGAPALPIVPLDSRPEVFDRSAVLSRPVVAYFLGGLTGPGLPAVPDSLTPAIGLTRSARLSEAREIALAAAPDHFASRFIAGLADLADGNLQGAASHLGGALQAAPTFTPAVFYLGAAYAAAGRDADAVTAWQSAFVVDQRAPWQHTLMADALLRLQQAPRALAVLREAAGAWPESDAVEMRLAMALAQDGADRDAMAVLVPYLDRHPDDLDRLLLGMRLIHDAHLARRTFDSPETDRQRFTTYFTIYERANGPELARAREWRRAIDR